MHGVRARRAGVVTLLISVVVATVGCTGSDEVPPSEQPTTISSTPPATTVSSTQPATTVSSTQPAMTSTSDAPESTSSTTTTAPPLVISGPASVDL